MAKHSSLATRNPIRVQAFAAAVAPAGADAVAGGGGLCMDMRRKRSAAIDSVSS
jgi:hypothetical protein